MVNGKKSLQNCLFCYVWRRKVVAGCGLAEDSDLLYILGRSDTLPNMSIAFSQELSKDCSCDTMAFRYRQSYRTASRLAMCTDEGGRV